MKKHLLFIFMFCAVLSHAQQPVVFMPPGAKWHYQFDSWSGMVTPGVTPRNKIAEYTGDTIIAGETFKKLAHPQFYKGTCNCSTTLTLIKQHGDTIFMKNSCVNGWQILYNFAAPVGTGWTVSTTGPSQYFAVQVNSVQVLTINGFSMKQMTLTVTNPASNQAPTYTTTITERFGADYIFYFNSGNCDGSIFNRLLCYQDNAFSVYQANSNVQCDYATNIAENNKDEALLIYPNPANDHITIKTPSQQSYNVIITDVVGKEVQRYKTKATTNTIDMSAFAKGMYYFRVSGDAGSSSYKVIKN